MPSRHRRRRDLLVAKQTEPMSYEQARDELATIVGTLEQGGLTLEESLTLWERGEQLAQMCQGLLDAASSRLDATASEASKDAD